ncbi:MAG: aldose 1-epimerase family protein [Bacteroidota bacterium]
MLHSIQNEALKVEVSSHGAELRSLHSKSYNKEYLWQGHREFWGRRAPVLFPIVGALKNGCYLYNGKKYNMPQHGFARDQEFQIVDKSLRSIAFLLRHNEQTLKSYPFHFDLLIIYDLSDAILTVTYEVLNTGSSDLLYSIGAHPAFNCPVNENEVRSEYALLFSGHEVLDRQYLDDGTRTGEKESVLNGQKQIIIADHLFDRDALVFQGIKSENVFLARADNTLVRVRVRDFDYLGLWSKNSSAPFVCIEPWMGIADHVDHNGVLEQKEGIRRLPPGDQEKFDFEIEIYEK